MPTTAESVQNQTLAIRLSFKWLSTNKTLTKEQKGKAAVVFNTNRESLTAGKKIIDSKIDKYARLTEIKNQIIELWKANTLPYVEDGVRLAIRSRIRGLDEELAKLRTDFETAREDLRSNFEAIVREAKSRLGDLFNPNDYPPDPASRFEVRWEYVATDPPEYLKDINPRLYEQEQQRARAKFDEAIRLAEEQMAEQFSELVRHLAEKLQPDETGAKKKFHASTLTNLQEFITQFRTLNITGNDQLEALVDRAERTIGAVDAKTLRQDFGTAQRISSQLQQIGELVAPMVTTERRRAIKLRVAPSETINAA